MNASHLHQDGGDSDVALSVAESSVGAKRPLLQKDKDGEPLSVKRLRRLEKNRLSARECRRRKREATENMQREIEELEQENLKLRLQLQIGEEAEESSQQEQKRLTESLDQLLKNGASENEIYSKIEEYKEKFADYGRDRRSAIEYHLRSVERLLKPTQTTSVVLATLQGGPLPSGHVDQAMGNDPQPSTIVSPTSTASVASMAKDASALTDESHFDTKSLFRHLVSTLEVTPQQAAALKDSRFVAQEMDECLRASLSALKDLDSRLSICGEDLEVAFDNVRACLTPTQAAKFLVWVANNHACMFMLNELWGKIYPEAPREVSDKEPEEEDKN